MNLLLWIGLTLFAFALWLLARAVRNAPVGCEDREGFHFEREPSLVPVTPKFERRDPPCIRPLRARGVRPDEVAA